MKYELPKEPPVGSKLLCTNARGVKLVFESKEIPDDYRYRFGTQTHRYLQEGTHWGYSDGRDWHNLLMSFVTVEDYVDEDAELRKELASTACGFDISILNSKNRKLIEDGMKLIIQMVRDYDAKKKEK